MDKLPGSDISEICTVTKLVDKLGLSRARFYQLVKMGIFPMPIYDIRTKRPFYTLTLQQKCLTIRTTGIGDNGRPVIFNAPRKEKSQGIQSRCHHKYQEFSEALRQMGHRVKPEMVKDALNYIYPKGIPANMDDGVISHKLYKYFKNECKKDV